MLLACTSKHGIFDSTLNPIIKAPMCEVRMYALHISSPEMRISYFLLTTHPENVYEQTLME